MVDTFIFQSSKYENFSVWHADHMLLTNWPFQYEPQRHTLVIDVFKYDFWTSRLVELGLIDRCKRLTYEKLKINDIVKLHSHDLYKTLENMSTLDLTEMEKIASNYDSVYFNKESFNAAVISASCAVQLVSDICTGSVQNGLAIVRPPGHHAMKNDFNGFCLFNNVAIAAQHALDRKLAKKILIVDFDVHHGQGTQQMFYNSDKVLYFSIHRYEYGKFWPNLPESNYDNIGAGDGKGYNINFPLNKTGLTDSDYLSIVFHILLPVAYEFQPDLIIMSAGYDGCIGCFEGEMNLTPGFYGHLITLLSGLAEGKIAVCLEGGYFIPSLAEGVSMTLKALLGDPLAILPPISLPDDTTVTTINNLKSVLRRFWNCFKMYSVYDPALVENCHQPCILYLGLPVVAPFDTRILYPDQGSYDAEKYATTIHKLQSEYAALPSQMPLSICFDEIVLLHKSDVPRHFERPERLAATYETFKSWGLDRRCIMLQPLPSDIGVLQGVHTKEYINYILNEQFEKIINSPDLYSDCNTKQVVLKTVDCMITVVDHVMEGNSSNGAALVRPPGHHAEKNKASGFCFLNNVAIAAQYLLDKYKLERVMIVDFDIHHGNGTQAIFYNSNKVLYTSIHKYDNGTFFPNSAEGSCEFYGSGDGKGYNVNVAINGDPLNNIDYIAIFHHIILPIAYSFAPQIILVSAGFDAGINDPLGNYKVSSDCFGHFIQMLMPASNGKLVLVLEGGYNITTLKYGWNICIKSLLGDPLPKLDLTPNAIRKTTFNCIEQVIAVQKPFWPILGIDKKLSSLPPKLITEEANLEEESPVTMSSE